MARKLKFILRRVLLTIPVLLALSVIVFAVLHFVPGDPVQTMLGVRATPENVATIRADLNLDDPLPSQYIAWLGGLVQGDLGTDYLSGVPVSELLGDALPVTVQLAVMSLLIALFVGVPLGVLSAERRGLPRWLAEGIAVGGVAIPDFWLSLLLILLFSVTLDLLPPQGYVPIQDGLQENLRYMLLPSIALAAGSTAYFIRTTRGAMLGVLHAPFVQYLRAKGVARRRILFGHALRNASAPVVTVVAIQFGYLLGGAVVVETIFALPGLGRMVVDAVNSRDYPVVQGSILVLAAMFIFVNLVADVLVGLLDPRVGDRQFDG
jgi:peptide/nickel transport system permease protein